MTEKIQVTVPDIGGVADVDVIEVLVKPGDPVALDDALITLEGDKATMEVPAVVEGTVAEIVIKVGDKVSAGDAILTLLPSSAAEAVVKEAAEKKNTDNTSKSEKPTQLDTVEPIVVPDLGDAQTVDVIEVHMQAGQSVAIDDPLVTLEGDKATMEVPAVKAGIVRSVSVKVGDKVASQSLLGQMEVTLKGGVSSSEPVVQQEVAVVEKPSRQKVVAATDVPVYASPAVRRIAHELEIDLASLKGSGEKGRITKEDVKRALGQSASSGALNVSSAPSVDFSQFGPVATQSLSKIKKLSGANLHRNWVSIPHVTQFDEADVTAMEAFRQQQKKQAAQQGLKLTPIVFIMKAVVSALKAFPQFNASLDASGENLIMKSYFHVGVAVDTPNGLVVPVIRDVDQKSLFELAAELGLISQKAREKGLTMKEMQGGCFTISSLGGIGGTAFTPIINAPEVAILGLSKSSRKPVYNAQGEIEPRLMMPLSLSYDHRVIDGAEAARFVVHLSRCLGDIRILLL